MWWARRYEVKLWLNVYLPTGEKYFISEKTNVGYTNDFTDTNQRTSWKSPASMDKNGVAKQNISKLHIQLNNKHVYPAIPKKKVGQQKGNMLSKNTSLTNLQGEYVKYIHARRIGIADYGIVGMIKDEKTGWRAESEKNLKILKNKLVRGTYHKYIRTLLIAHISFDEVLKSMMRYSLNKLQPLPYQVDVIGKSLVHPISEQLYKFIGNEKDVEDFIKRDKIRQRIQELYNEEIKSKRKQKMLLNFSCGNQSMGSIARNLFICNTRRELPHSKCNLFARDQFDKYFTKPFTQTMMDTDEAIMKYYRKWRHPQKGDAIDCYTGEVHKDVAHFIVYGEEDLDM